LGDQIEKNEAEGGSRILEGGREQEYTGFRWGNLGGRDHLEDPSVDGRIILRWIFRKWDGRYGMIRLRIGAGGGHL
jgi:hypothetical protein